MLIFKSRHLVLTSLLVVFVSSFAFGNSSCEDNFAKQESKKLVQPKDKNDLSSEPSIAVRLAKNIYRLYIKRDSRNLNGPVKKYDPLSDIDYIQEKRVNDKFGVVRSVFSKDLDTRVYFTATGVPDQHGVIPVVDPNARALYIYFHGSGTDKANGGNFAYKMNKMASFGYSVMSIDLPHHADGSQSRKMDNAEHFYAMINRMIETYRIDGMPVYLTGHSFGPTVIAEFAKRYPHAVDGLVMFSPGAFDQVMEDWYINHTSKMAAAWDNVGVNDDGGAWAGAISAHTTWTVPPTPYNLDAISLNPLLKVRLISGDREEYVPGELDERGLPTKKKRDYDVCKAFLKLMPKAICILEPGVGHHIFEHLDKDGYDVILRELLAIDGQSLANEKTLKATAKTGKADGYVEASRRYVRDPFFKAYVDSSLGGHDFIQQLILNKDDAQASTVLNYFGRYIYQQRERALIENIKNTANWNPQFYSENKAEIDAISAKNPISDNLVNRYFALISSLSPEAQLKYASVSQNVMKLPERQGPTPEMLEKQKIMDEKRAKKEAAKKLDQAS